MLRGAPCWRAIAAWTKSYELSRLPALWFDLGQAYRLGGDCKRARESFQQFVASDPASSHRKDADDLLAELARTCGRGQAAHPRPRDDEVGQVARRARRSACARRTRA